MISLAIARNGLGGDFGPQGLFQLNGDWLCFGFPSTGALTPDTERCVSG
jgi:hypothetical protein